MPGHDERIAVLAPSVNDAAVTARLLASAGFACTVVRDVAALCEVIAEGAAAALLAEEALAPRSAAEPLVALLRDQEPWSDLPVILFAGPRPNGLPTPAPTVETLAPFGNVTLLERPVQVITVVSAVRAALRARRRQYAARAFLAERALAEQALRDSDRRKTDFLGVLSHELRNPLAPIRNSILVLERAPPDGEQARRARDVIRRQTDHLSRLVDDLLDVTRISRGKVELQREILDAAEVVRRTAEDHRSLFEARRIELQVDAPGPAWVDADATRLAQVVGNLLQNAAKFSHPGGRVAARVAAAGDTVEIRVRDEGVGIAPDLLPRLFEPFVQADGGLSRVQGGLGLGLALVKGVVELHGGSVRAASEGVDRGAELVVSFPGARPPANAAPQARATGLARARVVLVIDDNLDSARTLADLLELDGHRVHVATDGRSGIAAAHDLRPDVVLCDIGLPDLDGYAVARAIRRDGALGATRLVALTGYGLPEDRERARKAGFDAHLVKPAPPEAIAAAVCGDEAGGAEGAGAGA